MFCPPHLSLEFQNQGCTGWYRLPANHRNVSVNNTFSEVTEPSTGLESPISPALNPAIHNPSEQVHLALGVVQQVKLDGDLSQPEPVKDVSACLWWQAYLPVPAWKMSLSPI